MDGSCHHRRLRPLHSHRTRPHSACPARQSAPVARVRGGPVGGCQRRNLRTPLPLYRLPASHSAHLAGDCFSTHAQPRRAGNCAARGVRRLHGRSTGGRSLPRAGAHRTPRLSRQPPLSVCGHAHCLASGHAPGRAAHRPDAGDSLRPHGLPHDVQRVALRPQPLHPCAEYVLRHGDESARADPVQQQSSGGAHHASDRSQAIHPTA